MVYRGEKSFLNKLLRLNKRNGMKQEGGKKEQRKKGRWGGREGRKNKEGIRDMKGKEKVTRKGRKRKDRKKGNWGGNGGKAGRKKGRKRD